MSSKILIPETETILTLAKDWQFFLPIHWYNSEFRGIYGDNPILLKDTVLIVKSIKSRAHGIGYSVIHFNLIILLEKGKQKKMKFFVKLEDANNIVVL